MAARVKDLKLTTMQARALAAWINEPDAAIAARFGVTKSAITHRRRRALKKLSPEQQAYYETRVNRRRNRSQVKPLGGVGATAALDNI